jgi:hypothetical protein
VLLRGRKGWSQSVLARPSRLGKWELGLPSLLEVLAGARRSDREEQASVP